MPGALAPLTADYKASAAPGMELGARASLGEGPAHGFLDVQLELWPGLLLNNPTALPPAELLVALGLAFGRGDGVPRAEHRASGQERTGHRAEFRGLVRGPCPRTCFDGCAGSEVRMLDGADLVQDIFFFAYQALGSFRGEAQVRTWLYRITARTVSRQRAEALIQLGRLIEADQAFSAVLARPALPSSLRARAP